MLAVNAVTVDELVQRITPDVQTATLGQRLIALQQALAQAKERTVAPGHASSDIVAGLNPRYFSDAVSELKNAGIRPAELQSAGAEPLAGILADYEEYLHARRPLRSAGPPGSRGSPRTGR